MGLATKIQPRLRSFEARVRIWGRRRPLLQTIAIVLVSGLVYGIAFRLAISTFLRDNLSVCWPIVGLQVAFFLRTPRRFWPQMITGMVIVQVTLEWSQPIDQVVSDTVSDVAELLIAAYCLPPLNGVSRWIKERGLLKRFIVWPALLGPAITGFPVAAAYSRDLDLHVSYWPYWARWFTGDAIGIVLWLPLGVILISRETYALFAWKNLSRTLGLLGTFSLVGWALFNYKPTPIAFLLMPFLLLIAFKLGFSGSAIAVNILSIVSAKGTLHRLGPFGSIQEPYSVTALQAFLAVSMLMCFPVSILQLERDDFERETREAYERMEKLAISDGLTGLANRRRFDDIFDQEWRRAMREGEPVGVMMIDVDSFKLFNDFYGHLAGDQCLRNIADSIRSTVNRAGDLPARFGGEEFVVLMPGTDLFGVLQVAEVLRYRIELLRLEHKRSLHQIVTVSVGCWSAIPKIGTLPASLIEAADQGLYSAKLNGRNRVSTISAEIEEAAVRAS
ncbi:diguanylate cyclase (GGDEF)-like protein [Granulicella aggregans]|uniref:diguanylate cyclase n=1 Tax=Granulicella aggregans TaxID=474949 RepID=A0A7W8E1I2_9BACT|nr:diguanylate cyclase [Granulicella aggregans]MBB5055863.1 diguanylate cyclase (GGDEF)-like protein [Granulicella aggregans]